MAAVTSFRLPRHHYTHSLISTNNSNSKPLCPSRRFFVNTSGFSSSRIIPINFNGCVVVARSNLNFPLISPDDNWGTWTALFATGAFGLCNMGIIPHEASAYSVVMEFILPLTIPLMLFRADMRDVIKSTGKLLLAFLIGSGFVSMNNHPFIIESD
ncbi:hypothetical protein L1987_35496 [Smallanthus sonchifolius]|uniref:Uncharacterized protein n=1 Tax=Smallanthus sonchifolius TaxID=185202 RepID=A0ACB9HY94_9ASTR|nr:hypothetical protein L1987_35496 [Smallanthus sonchifolius]